MSDISRHVDEMKRTAREFAEVSANPFEDWIVQPEPDVPRPSISLNHADGHTTVHPVDEWSIEVLFESRNARPDDPEYVDYLLTTIPTGRMTGTIRFTSTSEDYRP